MQFPSIRFCGLQSELCPSTEEDEFKALEDTLLFRTTVLNWFTLVMIDVNMGT